MYLGRVCPGLVFHVDGLSELLSEHIQLWRVLLVDKLGRLLSQFLIVNGN